MSHHADRVCVVTTAHGRHDHLARQRESLARAGLGADQHVVVAMDDATLAASGGADVALPRGAHGLPLAAARNRGAEEALRRGARTLVFLDVDCLAGPALPGAYAEVVAAYPGTVWSGPVTYLPEPSPDGYDLDRLAAMDSPHRGRPAPEPGELLHGADPDLFWSLSFACSAATWQRVGGFCEEYEGYGGEDTDFARLLVGRGVDLGWVGAARAYHQWHPVSSPPVEHVDDIVRNAALFRRRWGRTPMLGWLEELEARGLVERRGEAWTLAQHSRPSSGTTSSSR